MSDNYTGSARRCSDCDVNWPDTSNYETCPGCQQETWIAYRTRPLEAGPAHDLAKSIKETQKQRRERHEAFEKYYLEIAVDELYVDMENWIA